MGQPSRILVVEDEAVVALDLRARLERLGYEVVGTAASAAEAIESAATFSPDLVLMDIHLAGDSDGVAAAKAIRAEHRLPVLFLTAFTDEETIQRAAAAEPYGYLVKPFEAAELQAAVDVALEKHRADRGVQKVRDDLQAVLDAQQSGSVLVDGEGLVRFASTAARGLLGLPQRWLGRHWEELLAEAGSPAELVEALGDSHARPHRFDVGLDDEVEVEVEVVDDPRGGGGAAVFVYDRSERLALQRLLDEAPSFEGILGRSAGMRELFQSILSIAPTDAAVLIRGETGTGKELVARALHNRSSRREGPFVAVNCGGLADELAASELFGHRRGSFTGAVDDHRGWFEAADGGTLFLDEVGELSARNQVSLLRALEEGEIVRVGETQPRPVDVRVISATHRDLEAAGTTGDFREDLLYRLRVVELAIPALRERVEDVPLLASAFLARGRKRHGRGPLQFSEAAMGRLLQHPWPGNVRELRNAVEAAGLQARGESVEVDHLRQVSMRTPPEPVDEASRIRAALVASGGNRKRAAEILGISRATLYRRLEKLGDAVSQTPAE